MVRHVALLAAATALVACGSQKQQPRPAPRPERFGPAHARYDLDLAWDARAAMLTGTERISFVNTRPGTLGAVWLRLWPNAFGSCTRAVIRVTAGGRLGSRREECTAQEVVLARPLALGERGEVALRLTVRVPARPDRFGRFRGVAYLGNALPILAVADARGWRLPPYTSAGESFFSLSASWRVRLETPPGLAVASTGSAVGGALEAPHARDFMLAIGRMRITEQQAGSVRLRHFALPGDPPGGAERALRYAAGALRAFDRWYGPYDRPELDIVQGPSRIAGAGIAMEYPELVITPPYAGAVTHEVAHQWWWGIVGNDQRDEPWLDESFAEFSQARLPAAVGGPDRLARCARPRRPRLTAGMSVWEDARRGAYAREVYVGGACMLRRLEDGLGHRRFDAMLQGVVRDHRDGVWTRADFVAAVLRAAPTGFDARAFLRREGIIR